MTTADQLRQQAQAHRDAAKKLEAAAVILEHYGINGTVPNSPAPKTVKVAVKSNGIMVTEGVRENQDLCFKALKAAGAPMPVKDLLGAIRELGSLIARTDTVTLYCRSDEEKRFIRPAPGVWALNPDLSA